MEKYTPDTTFPDCESLGPYEGEEILNSFLFHGHSGTQC